jgi:hypothetical protein
MNCKLEKTWGGSRQGLFSSTIYASAGAQRTAMKHFNKDNLSPALK